MLQYTQNLFEHDRIRKQDKLILIRLLVVLDNASYHNVKTEDTVCANFSQKKAVLQNYILHNTTFPFLLLIPNKYYMKK